MKRDDTMDSYKGFFEGILMGGINCIGFVIGGGYVGDNECSSGLRLGDIL